MAEVEQAQIERHNGRRGFTADIFTDGLWLLPCAGCRTHGKLQKADFSKNPIQTLHSTAGGAEGGPLPPLAGVCPEYLPEYFLNISEYVYRTGAAPG